jgi:hypothetical protein
MVTETGLHEVVLVMEVQRGAAKAMRTSRA